jgi:flagellar hook-associated protein 1 FlgK
MSVSTILEAGKQSLLTQQRAIQVVGHNIANVNTPGYSRQRTELVPAHPSHSGVLKAGVSVDQVTRAFDRFLTGQVNTTASNASHTKTQADLLSQVEALFNDLGAENSSLAATLDRFFHSFQELATNPQGVPERTIIQGQGQAVADIFHALHTGLEDLKRDVNNALRDEVEQTNRVLQQIAELNNKIQQVESTPKDHANTLRDERELLLKTLSEQVAITSLEAPDGTLRVLLQGGRPVIDGGLVNPLLATVDANDPQRVVIHVQDRQGNSTDVSESMRSGKLAALMDVRDTFLSQVTTDVNRLAAQLTSSVNQVHSNGYGLDGSTGNAFFVPRQATGLPLAENTGGGRLQKVVVFDPTQLTLDDYRITFVGSGPPVTFDIVNTTTGVTLAAGQTYSAGMAIRFDGIEVVIGDSGLAPQVGDVFTISTTQDAAKNIAIAPGVLANVKTIAAGQTPRPGDNSNALALADLGAAVVIEGQTMREFYNTVVSRLGADSQSRQDRSTHQQLVLTELENRREALAGVSLDEEQIDLIRYQQAYNAAANLIRIADEMADTIVSLIR